MFILCKKTNYAQHTASYNDKYDDDDDEDDEDYNKRIMYNIKLLICKIMKMLP